MAVRRRIRAPIFWQGLGIRCADGRWSEKRFAARAPDSAERPGLLKTVAKGRLSRQQEKSDRVLVYVSDGPTKHLLMFILDDPGAHAVAAMRNRADRETMLGFAEVAAEFLATGKILN